MFDTWTWLSAVWLVVCLFSLVRVTMTNREVLGVACLGIWTYAAAWGIKSIWW